MGKITTCWDTDGTKTDFKAFVIKFAYPYFKKKYGWEPAYPHKLEVEDIFDIKNVLIKSENLTEQEALAKMKKILDKFWISLRFVQFSLLNRFRKGVASEIRQQKKDGFEVEIHTSRAKTTKQNIIGSIARGFTRMQYRLNGVFIPKNKIYFYENDATKIAGLKQKSEQGKIIVFEDKPGMVDGVRDFADTVCIATDYNEDIQEIREPKIARKVIKITDFENGKATEALETILGKETYKALKRKHKSEKLYRFLIKVVSRAILKEYKPWVINGEDLIKTNESVTYAPNHIKTVDPLIITAIIKEPIHWVALKRFFDAEDSIFNNDKGYLKRKFTAIMFKALEFFPIERLEDNPQANNMQALRDMHHFSKAQASLGNFPEGTTRKDKSGLDFVNWDDTFLRMAEKNDGWIQPIRTVWLNDSEYEEYRNLGFDHKLVVNIGQAFKVGDMTNEEAKRKYLEIQEAILAEIKTRRAKRKEELKAKQGQSYTMRKPIL